MKPTKPMKITPVDEVNWGLYAWQMPDGSIVMDEEGAYLSIPSMKGDIRQIKKLKDVAHHYGLEEGKPIFFAGHRAVTDEELEEQRQRLELGLVPDTQDLPGMMDYIKEMREMKLG
jgi:hypothetical protein